MRQRSSFFDPFIRFHSKFTWVTWTCLVLAMSGAICLAICARMCRFEWLYHAGARTTQDTVIGKSSSRSSRGIGTVPSSRVRYEY